MTQSRCIISVSGPVLLEKERAFLREAQPFGVILMGRSCKDRDQIKRLNSDIQNAIGKSVPIFIDQEGGRVARLKPPVWPKFPAAGVYGALYQEDPEYALEACKLGHHLMALELSDLGIFADCAPDLDLRQDETHDAIGDRSFGYDVDAVVSLGRAAMDGLKLGGVLGVMKHMPGQGRAVVDSHYDVPEVDADMGQLDQDFSIFKALAERATMGMTGHVCYTVIAPGEPATVSDRIISDIIRGRIGFDGLLMTDDLGMDALGGSLAERGKRALAAGCDVLLHCSGFLSDPDEILTEMEMVVESSGTLDGEAKRRADHVEAAIPAATPLDSVAAWSRFHELVAPVTGGLV